MRRLDRVTDLTLVGALLFGAVAALLVPGVPWPLEWAVAIPLILFVPGYTLVAALFPASPAAATRSPGWVPRLALALVASVLVVAVVGTILSLVGSLQLVPVVLALAATSAASAAFARYRRRTLAVEDWSDACAAVGQRSLTAGIGLSGLQTAALFLGAVALVGAVAITGASPSQGESFSEASLLEAGDGEELLGANDTVTLGENQPNTVRLRIQNHEGEETTYHVVGQLQRLGPNGNVQEYATVDQGEATVAAGDTVVLDRQLDPWIRGDTLRLQYLVYTDSVPESPSARTADLTLHNWVVVEDSTE
jgi:uncharacterized membrane protein